MFTFLANEEILSPAVLMINMKGNRHCLLVGIDNMLGSILAHTALVEVARFLKTKVNNGGIYRNLLSCLATAKNTQPTNSETNKKIHSKLFIFLILLYQHNCRKKSHK